MDTWLIALFKLDNLMFANPIWLWAIFLWPLLWGVQALLQRKWGKQPDDLSQLKTQSQLQVKHPLVDQLHQNTLELEPTPSHISLFQLGLNLLRGVLIVSLAITLAQPEKIQILPPDTPQKTVRDIVFVIESSASLLLPDYQINGLPESRMNVVKLVLDQFIAGLKGNRFEIILTHISANDAKRFDKVAEKMSREGFPNYYGYQRFGEDSKSWQQGKEIAHSGKRLKGAKEKLLVSAYQSYLFNRWLSQRVNLSQVVTQKKPVEAAEILGYPIPLVKELAKQKQFFKLFIGEALMQYPYGKQSYCKDTYHASLRFQKKEISPTGLLAGDKVSRAKADAGYLEERHDDDELTSLRGDRRFAWIWAEAFSSQYNKETQTLTVRFTLPKGAYATAFLEEIGKFSLRPERKKIIT